LIIQYTAQAVPSTVFQLSIFDIDCISHQFSAHIDATVLFQASFTQLAPKFKTYVSQILVPQISLNASFPFIVSNGSHNTATVTIADIHNINCTKNHENGTINTQITNLGKACFISHTSCHLPIIFINAIAISKKAKMKYTIFEIMIHISLR